MWWVYSATPADWAFDGGVLPISGNAVSVSSNPNGLGHIFAWIKLVALLSVKEWISQPQQGQKTWAIFKWSTPDLNSENFFSQTGYLTKAKETHLFYYVTIAKERIDEFMSFLMAVALREI